MNKTNNDIVFAHTKRKQVFKICFLSKRLWYKFNIYGYN